MQRFLLTKGVYLIRVFREFDVEKRGKTAPGNDADAKTELTWSFKKRYLLVCNYISQPRPKLSVASADWMYTDSVHCGTLMAHCHTLTHYSSGKSNSV